MYIAEHSGRHHASASHTTQHSAHATVVTIHQRSKKKVGLTSPTRSSSACCCPAWWPGSAGRQHSARNAASSRSPTASAAAARRPLLLPAGDGSLGALGSSTSVGNSHPTLNQLSRSAASHCPWEPAQSAAGPGWEGGRVARAWRSPQRHRGKGAGRRPASYMPVVQPSVHCCRRPRPRTFRHQVVACNRQRRRGQGHIGMQQRDAVAPQRRGEQVAGGAEGAPRAHGQLQDGGRLEEYMLAEGQCINAIYAAEQNEV